MKVVRVQVCEVDVIGFEIGDELGGRLWEIPPAASVAGADQPGVRDYAHAVVIHA